MFLFPLTNTDYNRPVKQKRIFEDSERIFLKNFGAIETVTSLQNSTKIRISKFKCSFLIKEKLKLCL